MVLQFPILFSLIVLALNVVSNEGNYHLVCAPNVGVSVNSVRFQELLLQHIVYSSSKNSLCDSSILWVA